MIRRMRVVRAEAVEEWLASPHRDPRRATATRVKFKHAVRIIEQMGTLAGDDYLRKLAGHDALWETTIGDRRVFSTILENNVLMAVVEEKKKRKFGPGKLKAVEAQVQRFAEKWREENKGEQGR